MASWEEIDTTLIQLFTGDAARGRVRRAFRKALLNLDEPFASRHFKDNDAAVKAALDALADLGILYFANQRLTSKPSCDVCSCSDHLLVVSQILAQHMWVGCFKLTCSVLCRSSGRQRTNSLVSFRAASQPFRICAR